MFSLIGKVVGQSVILNPETGEEKIESQQVEVWCLNRQGITHTTVFPNRHRADYARRSYIRRTGKHAEIQKKIITVDLTFAK